MQANGQISLETLLKNLLNGKKLKLDSSVENEVSLLSEQITDEPPEILE